MAKKKVIIRPGMMVKYIYSQNGPVIPENYDGNLNIEKYSQLLSKALYTIIPFQTEKPTKLTDFFTLKEIYVPMKVNYSERKGLSEKIFKRKMEKEGWIVWKGALIGVESEYPNVIRKYKLLEKVLGDKYEHIKYISHVHHGIPDVICYRKGEIKFIECKLINEQLSKSQKKCIALLQKMNFKVEVHRLMKISQRFKQVRKDMLTNKKIIVEQQVRIKKHYS